MFGRKAIEENIRILFAEFDKIYIKIGSIEQAIEELQERNEKSQKELKQAQSSLKKRGRPRKVKGYGCK